MQATKGRGHFGREGGVVRTHFILPPLSRVELAVARNSDDKHPPTPCAANNTSTGTNKTHAPTPPTQTRRACRSAPITPNATTTSPAGRPRPHSLGGVVLEAVQEADRLLRGAELPLPPDRQVRGDGLVVRHLHGAGPKGQLAGTSVTWGRDAHNRRDLGSDRWNHNGHAKTNTYNRGGNRKLSSLGGGGRRPGTRLED